jgi:hypothetical protein
MRQRKVEDKDMGPRVIRFASLTAPVLLVIVGLFSVFQYVHHDQSSWSGAGFGMFATIDGEATRSVRGYLAKDGDRKPEELPSKLDRQAFEVQVLPTEKRLLDLGRDWLEAIEAGPDARMIVEVWGVEFDAHRVVLSRILIRSVQVEMAS